MTVVRPFAEQLLRSWGVKMAKTSELRAYTEVEFAGSDGEGKDRPDGLLYLSARKKKWAAVVEAKVGNEKIPEEQVQRYGKSVRGRVNAVVTISNQLAPLPSHVPYSVPKRLRNGVDFYHTSWASVLTEARLLLKDGDAKREMDPEQEYILEELALYMEHPSSGVQRFEQMNADWRTMVLGLRSGKQFPSSSIEVENTVGGWHQEVRDLCLILSLCIGERVKVRLPRKHQADPELRLRSDGDRLAGSWELRCALLVPNAASDIEIVVDLKSRTVSCAMKLFAPGHRKRASAKINWLLRQLGSVTRTEEVSVRVFWPGRAAPTQESLAAIRDSPRCLEHGREGLVPTSFEVLMIPRVLGKRFAGRRTFVEDLERLVERFYEEVGQNLRAWTPPPPPIDKSESRVGRPDEDQVRG
ncbi:MAG: hypothetical protein F4080_15180 [Holophagales bacterium]|nr:hypothetical protein [Holophagales bacterium]